MHTVITIAETTNSKIVKILVIHHGAHDPHRRVGHDHDPRRRVGHGNGPARKLLGKRGDVWNRCKCKRIDV